VRLPDLLVAEGVVHPQTVVEIFEAQALYGGAFDTNLIERGVLDERRLLPYLERAYSVQNRVDVTTEPAHDALERLTRKLAEQHRVVPFRVVGRTLDVVCADPSDLRALDEVAFETGCRLAVNVAIEARVAQLLAHGYGLPMPSRMAAILAGKVWARPLLVKRAWSVPQQAGGSGPLPASFASLPITSINDTERLPRIESDTRPVRRIPGTETEQIVRVEPGPMPAPGRVPAPVPAPAPAPAPPQAVAASPRPATLSTSSRPADESVTERVLRAEPEGLAPPLPARDVPHSEAELAQRLAAVTERDQIPPIVLAYLEGLPRVLLLRVRKNELAGWDGHGAVDRERVPDLALPLALPSVFASVIADVTPYAGPLPQGNVEAALLAHLRAEAWPAEALLVPIRVKGRVVALLYADAPARGVLGAARDAIIAAARHTAEALVSLILLKKQS
jgi:hypothetical protein